LKIPLLKEALWAAMRERMEDCLIIPEDRYNACRGACRILSHVKQGKHDEEKQ
jgi:hypothetical protein